MKNIHIYLSSGLLLLPTQVSTRKAPLMSKKEKHTLIYMRKKVSLVYPKGTFQVVPFYFRGDDTYKEHEYLAEQMNSSFDKYKNSLSEYEAAMKEFKDVSAEAEEADEYVLKLSSNISSEHVTINEGHALRQKIYDLSSKIEETDIKISKIHEMTSPNRLSCLMNEYSGYSPEIENLKIPTKGESIYAKSMKKEIGSVLLSNEFTDSIGMLTEHQVALRCKNLLRMSLDEKLRQINEEQSTYTHILPAAASSTDPQVIELLEELAELKLSLLESDLQVRLATIHRESLIKYQMDRLSEANEFLTLMSVEGEDLNLVLSSLESEETEEETIMENQNSEE